jgi:hypothetical protein
MTNMTHKELITSNEYKQFLAIKHSEIKSLIVTEVEKQSIWARIANMYQITGLLAFVLGLFKAFMPFFTKRESIYLIWLALGLIFTFTLLIIMHELIHALAYRYVGARNLSFGMNIRKFMFYVQADKQVLNYKQFKIVALAPVVTVAIISILGMIIFYNHAAFYFFIPIFAFHSMFCGGDFGLLCIFANHKGMEILTFDDKLNKTSFFYGKPLSF